MSYRYGQDKCEYKKYADTEFSSIALEVLKIRVNMWDLKMNYNMPFKGGHVHYAERNRGCAEQTS